MSKFKVTRWDQNRFDVSYDEVWKVWSTHAGVAFDNIVTPLPDVRTMSREEARRFAEKILELTEQP